MLLMCACHEERSKGNWPTIKQIGSPLASSAFSQSILLEIPGQTSQTPSQATDVVIAFLGRTRRSCTSSLWGQVMTECYEVWSIRKERLKRSSNRLLFNYSLFSYSSVPPTAVQSWGQPLAAETRKSSMPLASYNGSCNKIRRRGGERFSAAPSCAAN